jgi:hypothetical protein
MFFSEICGAARRIISRHSTRSPIMISLDDFLPVWFLSTRRYAPNIWKFLGTCIIFIRCDAGTIRYNVCGYIHAI